MAAAGEDTELLLSREQTPIHRCIEGSYSCETIEG